MLKKRKGMPWVRLPLGFKFQPTDEDLVLGYLLPKYRGENLPLEFITFSDDVYEKPPSQFCTDSTAFFGHDNIGKHYFFTDLNRAKERADRTVGSHGYWHESSKKKIKNNNNEIIGYKKLLNFKLKGEGKKTTGWLMHEFSPCLNEGESKNLVLCVIQNKEEKGTGSCLVLGLDSGSDSGSGRLEIARVKSCSDEEIAEAERGTGGLDQTVPQSDEEDIAGVLDRALAVDTVPQFDKGAGKRLMQELTDLLYDSTTTANKNPCPAQDEETQQGKKMRYNPQLEDDLIHPFSTYSQIELHIADLSHSVLL